MVDYLVSVRDEDLKSHEHYDRISQKDMGLLPFSEHKESSCTLLGLGYDGRWYFTCPSDELIEVTGYLISSLSKIEELTIHPSGFIELPENLK